MKKGKKFDKTNITVHVLQVKARATTREVMATYSIEDIVIELIIQLPSNYPLGSITVESGRRVGVAVQQWRNWMLQLSTYLTHQVGSHTHLASTLRAPRWLLPMAVRLTHIPCSRWKWVAWLLGWHRFVPE